MLVVATGGGGTIKVTARISGTMRQLACAVYSYHPHTHTQAYSYTHTHTCLAGAAGQIASCHFSQSYSSLSSASLSKQYYFPEVSLSLSGGLTPCRHLRPSSGQYFPEVLHSIYLNVLAFISVMEIIVDPAV